MPRLLRREKHVSVHELTCGRAVFPKNWKNPSISATASPWHHPAFWGNAGCFLPPCQAPNMRARDLFLKSRLTQHRSEQADQLLCLFFFFSKSITRSIKALKERLKASVLSASETHRAIWFPATPFPSLQASVHSVGPAASLPLTSTTQKTQQVNRAIPPFNFIFLLYCLEHFPKRNSVFLLA